MVIPIESSLMRIRMVLLLIIRHHMRRVTIMMIIVIRILLGVGKTVQKQVFPVMPLGGLNQCLRFLQVK